MTSLGPVDRFVAGAVGLPGQRTFYLEIEVDGTTRWFVLEKEQVAVLAARCLELVEGTVTEPSGGADVQPPTHVEFRVAEIRLGYDGGDRMTLLLTATDEDGGDVVEFEASVPQVAAMANRALEVVAAGRPICSFCKLPQDPAGHDCPARNGHRRPT